MTEFDQGQGRIPRRLLLLGGGATALSLLAGCQEVPTPSEGSTVSLESTSHGLAALFLADRKRPENGTLVMVFGAYTFSREPRFIYELGMQDLRFRSTFEMITIGAGRPGETHTVNMFATLTDKNNGVSILNASLYSFPHDDTHTVVIDWRDAKFTKNSRRHRSLDNFEFEILFD